MSAFMRCSIAVFVLFASLALLVPSSARVDSMVLDCATPTPGGTIPGPEPIEFYLSATKSVTLTTIFTVSNSENTAAQIKVQFFSVPGCQKSQVEIFGTIPARKSSTYFIDNYFNGDFTGEIYIRSGLVVTGTSEISRRYAKFYLPTIRKQ